MPENIKITSTLVAIIVSLKEIGLFEATFIPFCEAMGADKSDEQRIEVLDVVLKQSLLLFETRIFLDEFKADMEMKEAVQLILKIWIYRMFSEPAFKEKNNGLAAIQKKFFGEQLDIHDGFRIKSRARIVWGLFAMHNLSLISDQHLELIDKFSINYSFLNYPRLWNLLIIPFRNSFRDIGAFLIENKALPINELSSALHGWISSSTRVKLDRYIMQRIGFIAPFKLNVSIQPIGRIVEMTQRIYSDSVRRSASESIYALVKKINLTTYLFSDEEYHRLLKDTVEKLPETSKKAVIKRAINRIESIDLYGPKADAIDSASGVHLSSLFRLFLSITQDPYFLRETQPLLPLYEHLVTLSKEEVQKASKALFLLDGKQLPGNCKFSSLQSLALVQEFNAMVKSAKIEEAMALYEKMASSSLFSLCAAGIWFAVQPHINRQILCDIRVPVREAFEQMFDNARNRLFETLYRIQRAGNSAGPDREPIDKPCSLQDSFVVFIHEMQGVMMDCGVKIKTRDSNTTFFELKTCFIQYFKKELNKIIQEAVTVEKQEAVESMLKRLKDFGFCEQQVRKMELLPYKLGKINYGALLRLVIEGEVFHQLRLEWEREYKPCFIPKEGADDFWENIKENYFTPLGGDLKKELLDSVELPWRIEETRPHKKRKLTMESI